MLSRASELRSICRNQTLKVKISARESHFQQIVAQIRFCNTAIRLRVAQISLSATRIQLSETGLLPRDAAVGGRKKLVRKVVSVIQSRAIAVEQREVETGSRCGQRAKSNAQIQLR